MDKHTLYSLLKERHRVTSEICNLIEIYEAKTRAAYRRPE